MNKFLIKPYKKVIVNHIPLSQISLLKRQTSEFKHYFSQLPLKGFIETEKGSLAFYFLFRGVLYTTFGYDPNQVFCPENLKFLIRDVLSEFYSFKKDGYVNPQNLETNKVFKIFRSFYPVYNNMFSTKDTFRLSILSELEHLHNLIILILLYDLEMTLRLVESRYDAEKKLNNEVGSVLSDRTGEVFFDLKEERSQLQKTLSGGIRVSLSKNRVVYTRRLYVGFDTEYKPLDSQTNKLLCYTTASITECLIKIRSDNVDFSLKEGSVFLPKTSCLIKTGVGLIRLLRNKKDFEISELNRLLTEEGSFECLRQKNGDLVYRLKSFDFKDIRSRYIELTSTPQAYSFKNLMDQVLEGHPEIENKTFLELTRKLNIKPTFKNECSIIAHFTTTDVSLFYDFEGIKTNFTVISKSFLTLDKFITYKGWRVFLRDTSLLSPGGMSLKSIGSLYPSLPLKKVELSVDYYRDMEKLLFENPVLFREYALQDAKIVLWHTLEVQKSHYKFTGKYTIPVTLSSLASSFLENRLVISGNGRYHPKTLNGLISVRNIPKMMTPAGVELSGDLHEYLDYFLGSYHGGRNESYIYGVVKGEFYDYDLPGAYPTAMSLLDYPAWDKKQMIHPQSGTEFITLIGEEKIMKSYTALKIKFEFPSTVKYPNLPVRLDFTSIIFPSTGETFCTGLELLLALRLECKIRIMGGVYIPFQGKNVGLKPRLSVKSSLLRPVMRPVMEPKLLDLVNNYREDLSDSLSHSTLIRNLDSSKGENYHSLKTQLDNNTNTTKTENLETTETDFYEVVEEVLTERLKYPKGSYMNLLYKFIANAGIGQMARGLNQKKRYDSQSNSSRTQPAGALISPLYAGWITSYIRSTLSEIMNMNSSTQIVSCTTDGFISNVKDLDKYTPKDNDLFSSIYYKTRAKLTGSGALLETKYYEPKGVISWRTRGQLGLSGGIKALTGYQRHESIEQTIDKVNKSFNTSKQIAFIQTSLRSAKEIYQDGGHSTLKLEERIFNLKFDNRREVTVGHDGYHETKPFYDKSHSTQFRLISSFGAGRYRMYSPISVSHCKGDAYLSLTRRMIVRLLRTGNYLSNTRLSFSRREVSKILTEIGLKTSLNFISRQKNKPLILNSIPSTPKTLDCLEKLHVIFPSFDATMLIR